MIKSFSKGFLQLNKNPNMIIYFKNIEIKKVRATYYIEAYDIDTKKHKLDNKLIELLNQIYYQNKYFHLVTYNNNKKYLYLNCTMTVPAGIPESYYDFVIAGKCVI